MCFSKVSPSHKRTIYMVPKPNLDGNSIIQPFRLVHLIEVYSLRHVESYRTSACAHNGDYTKDRDVWLQCVPPPKSNKGFSNMVLHTLSLGSLSILPWLEVSEKGEAPFGLGLFEVHPNNSHWVSLSIMGLEYINVFNTNPYGIHLGSSIDNLFCTHYNSNPLWTPHFLGSNHRKSLVEICFWKKENPNRNPKCVHAALSMRTHHYPMCAQLRAHVYTSVRTYVDLVRTYVIVNWLILWKITLFL